MPECVQVNLDVLGNADLLPVRLESFLQGAKKSFYSAVLPGAKSLRRTRPCRCYGGQGVGGLFANAEQPEGGKHQLGIEDGFVVGSQELGSTVTINDSEQYAKDAKTGSVADGLEAEQASGPVIDYAQDWRRVWTIRCKGQIHTPTPVSRTFLAFASIEFLATKQNFLAMTFQRFSHKSLAHGFAPPLKTGVKSRCNRAATFTEHQSLQPNHFLNHPSRLLTRLTTGEWLAQPRLSLTTHAMLTSQTLLRPKPNPNKPTQYPKNQSKNQIHQNPKKNHHPPQNRALYCTTGSLPVMTKCRELNLTRSPELNRAMLWVGPPVLRAGWSRREQRI